MRKTIIVFCVILLSIISVAYAEENTLALEGVDTLQKSQKEFSLSNIYSQYKGFGGYGNLDVNVAFPTFGYRYGVTDKIEILLSMSMFHYRALYNDEKLYTENGLGEGLIGLKYRFLNDVPFNRAYRKVKQRFKCKFYRDPKTGKFIPADTIPEDVKIKRVYCQDVKTGRYVDREKCLHRGHPAVAGYFALTLPTATKDYIGEKNACPILGLVAKKDIGFLNVYGNTEYMWVHNGIDNYLVGIGLSKTIKRFAPMVEYVWQNDERQDIFLGTHYKMGKDLNLTVGFGKGIDRNSPDFSVLTGVAYKFGIKKPKGVKK